jgi:hypothetical protein
MRVTKSGDTKNRFLTGKVFLEEHSWVHTFSILLLSIKFELSKFLILVDV